MAPSWGAFASLRQASFTVFPLRHRYCCYSAVFATQVFGYSVAAL